MLARRRQVLSTGLGFVSPKVVKRYVQWLTDEYKLSPSEIAQVLGTSAEYKVSEVADRNAGIVLKINKERLKSLTAAK